MWRSSRSPPTSTPTSAWKSIAWAPCSTPWPGSVSSEIRCCNGQVSTRSRAIQPERARAVKTALDRADGIRTGKERGAAAVLDQLDALAAQLESDAAAAAGRDAVRLRSLAAAIKGRTAKLR